MDRGRLTAPRGTSPVAVEATPQVPPQALLSNPFSVLSDADPEGACLPTSLPRRQLQETGVPDSKPRAPAVPPNPVADAGRLPVVEATEDEALCAAVNEAQEMSAGKEAACAEAPHAAKEAAGRRQRAEVERRRRSQLVQNIALCEKLGIRYSTRGAAPPPPAGRRD